MLRINIVLLVLVHFSAFAIPLSEGEIIVDGVTVEDMKQAEKLISDGSTIYLGPGIYSNGIHIRKNNVTLSGSEGTHFVDAAIEGKAAIVTSGENTVIENIECSRIKVSSGNGACIRHQGRNLTVLYSYFHDSQQGILEAKNNGSLTIKYSRFERLGNRGRAHGIYTNGAELTVENSTFLSMVSQGHAIKSRSIVTTINNTFISTEDGKDSRLIDISSGGILNLSNSVLIQTNSTVNRQLIGFGLERMNTNRKHHLNIQNNLVIGERERGNEYILVAPPKKWDAKVELVSEVHSNVIVGKYYDIDKWKSGNTWYKDRADAGLSLDNSSFLSTLKSTLALLSDAELSNANHDSFRTVYHSEKEESEEAKILFEPENWTLVGPDHTSARSLLNSKNTVFVDSSKSLIKALKNAQPGQTIVIEDGNYKLKAKKIKISNQRTDKHSPIHLTARNPGKVTLQLASLEGIYLNQPHWIISGLRFQGICKKHGQCEHAIHVVGNASFTQILHNEFLDFNAAIKVNRIKKAFPDNGVIQFNHFYSSAPRNTNHPVTPINIDHGNNWLVSRNIIQDFIKTRGNKVSYAAFIKGGSLGGEFSNNLVVCSTDTAMARGRSTVGLSIGGGGMKDRRDNANFEASNVLVSNNIIFNCSDVGIYVNKGKDSLIQNNSLINTSGIDVRFLESDALVINNLYSGKIRKRDNATIKKNSGNVQLSRTLSLTDDLKSFALSKAFNALTQGKNGTPVDAPYDFCGKKLTNHFVGASQDYRRCFDNK
ncbi:hypothetical protein P7F88_20395 [Vibrio hannami]|uniref:hypothetical protein n=1 Tax=Vibrio hannami TaxID=2717094 RepID=UPI00240F4E89|nr:hypothetical protein [Vibrio hannami]MDG3088302.1 hypothetical protein [Vibrio hannami]